MNDLAWAVVEPQLPAALPGGRPRTTNLRAVVNAIFYLLRTSCQWRLLPREYPPRSTVYHYFSVWRAQGVWTRMERALHKQVRVTAGRAARATSPFLLTLYAFGVLFLGIKLLMMTEIVVIPFVAHLFG
jgi:putative transposase